MILIEIPSQETIEWVVVGNFSNQRLIEAGFEERIDGFVQEYEGCMLRLKMNGPICYISFEGSLEFSHVIVDYVCQQLQLQKKCLRVFVPTISPTNMERIFQHAGFQLVEENSHCRRYKFKEVSALLISEGYYLQIRGEHQKDWNRLIKQLDQYKKLIQPRTYKRKLKVS